MATMAVDYDKVLEDRLAEAVEALLRHIEVRAPAVAGKPEDLGSRYAMDTARLAERVRHRQRLVACKLPGVAR